jgi:hypothetical protein
VAALLERTFTKGGQTAISTNAATATYLLSQGWTEVGGTTLEVPASTADLLSVLPNRNLFRNGNFDVWQRGVGPFTSQAVNFCADGWKTGTSGQTLSILRKASVATDPPRSRAYAEITLGTPGATPHFYLNQYVEGLHRTAGEDVVVSFWAKGPAGAKIAFEIQRVFGTGGSPSAADGFNVPGTITLTSTWQRYEIRYKMPSLAGKTLGTNADDYLAWTWWLSAGAHIGARADNIGGQGGVFSIAQAQMEIGTQATPFEIVPVSQTWAHCQRYFQILKYGDVNWPTFTRPNTASGNAYYGSFQWLAKPFRLNASYAAYVIRNTSQTIHKPNVRWDGVSSVGFTVDEGGLAVTMSPSIDDGNGHYAIFPFGVDFYYNCDF